MNFKKFFLAISLGVLPLAAYGVDVVTVKRVATVKPVQYRVINPDGTVNDPHVYSSLLDGITCNADIVLLKIDGKFQTLRFAADTGIASAGFYDYTPSGNNPEVDIIIDTSKKVTKHVPVDL